MTTTDFDLNSWNTVTSEGSAAYSVVRAGLDLYIYPTNSRVGQLGHAGPSAPYTIEEWFCEFDTAAIGSAATITAAVLKVKFIDNSTTDFTVEAFASDFGTSITTADWVAGADLGALTKVATWDTSGFVDQVTYADFTESGSNLRSAINKTGKTRLLLASDRHRVGTTPAGAEWMNVVFDPTTVTFPETSIRLTVTYEPPPTTKTATFDAVLGATIPKTVTLDAAMGTARTKTATFDAALAPRTLKTATFDILLLSPTNQAVAFDAVLVDPRTTPNGSFGSGSARVGLANKLPAGSARAVRMTGVGTARTPRPGGGS